MNKAKSTEMFLEKQETDRWQIPIFKDSHQPPPIYEYYVDNLWFETSGINQAQINAPLKGSQKADIVIAGGGLAGLSSAFHLIQTFPDKRIVLLEGAICGYGASGRNGGLISGGIHGLERILEKEGPEKARWIFDVTLQGLEQIKAFEVDHGLNFDLELNGNISLATEEKHLNILGSVKDTFDKLDLESRIIDKDELQNSIKSTRYIGGLYNPYGGFLDPAKLARGMKSLVEELGVEVFEGSRILSINPGRTQLVETEFGEIEASKVVITLNGYAPQIGFFKNRVLPLTNHVIATEPLTSEQMDSIGWKNREGLNDLRSMFDYFRLTVDNRIVFGGEEMLYFYNNTPSTGNYKPIVDNLINSLYVTFPQLKGIRITHAWGGTMGFTLDFFPSIGVTGAHQNIYYATGFSGNGVVLTQLAGKLISQLMAGDDAEILQLPFINHRIPWAGFEPFRFPISRILLRLMTKYGLAQFL